MEVQLQEVSMDCGPAEVRRASLGNSTPDLRSGHGFAREPAPRAGRREELVACSLFSAPMASGFVRIPGRGLRAHAFARASERPSTRTSRPLPGESQSTSEGPMSSLSSHTVCPRQCTASKGLLDAWRDVYGPRVLEALSASGCAAGGGPEKTHKVILTGHSQGGAFATLAAYFLHRAGFDVQLSWAIGAGRPGNQALMDFILGRVVYVCVCVCEWVPLRVCVCCLLSPHGMEVLTEVVTKGSPRQLVESSSLLTAKLLIALLPTPSDGEHIERLRPDPLGVRGPTGTSIFRFPTSRPALSAKFCPNPHDERRVGLDENSATSKLMGGIRQSRFRWLWWDLSATDRVVKRAVTIGGLRWGRS